jgi:hypothetical protein
MGTVLQMALPKGIPVARHTPPKHVVVPEGELPLIDPKDPPNKQIQEVWTARIKVFDLSNDVQREEYEKVWQAVCDGNARISESQVNFVASDAKYVALLRWADLTYKIPQTT